MKMSTLILSTWIKGITGHNNLAYFKSLQEPTIDPRCRLCTMENETLHHLLTDCEATNQLQREILEDKIITSDHTWSIKRILKFMQSPRINELLPYKPNYAEREREREREIIYGPQLFFGFVRIIITERVG